MKIAICGTRGVPACYGGFETFAEELGARLVERGHEVVVYGRRHVIDYPDPVYRGMSLRLLSAPRHKYLETPIHSLLSFLHLLRHRVDVVLLCNAANSPFAWVLRLGRMPVAINVDGIERRRAKWNMLGRLWYRLGEVSSVAFASRIVADATVIQDYYALTYGAYSEVIRYGCRAVPAAVVEAKLSGGIAPTLSSEAVFNALGVRPGGYILYVSRLEPENNAHVAIRAYNRLHATLRADTPLLIVGDAPYADDYKEQLRSQATEGVIFAGYRFGKEYEVLQQGALVYLQATEVGGTHPALVEAMGFANCIIANDTPEHREVLGDSGRYYPKNDADCLSDVLAELLADRTAIYAARRAAYSRAQMEFDWEKIASQYESLFGELV